MLSEIFKKIDIFGIIFNFSTLGKEKFKTILGSLMTIFCVVAISIFTFFFGQNFYFRENPMVLTQTVLPENYSDLNPLTNENFFFAWRISDDYSATFNHTGKFYPYILYYHYDNIIEEDLQYYEIESVPCSSPEYYDKDFAKSFKADNWQCIDWKKYNDTLKFGGMG